MISLLALGKVMKLFYISQIFTRKKNHLEPAQEFQEIPNCSPHPISSFISF